jgi:hypothetical protein
MTVLDLEKGDCTRICAQIVSSIAGKTKRIVQSK